jgi:hypothetical protein
MVSTICKNWAPSSATHASWLLVKPPMDRLGHATSNYFFSGKEQDSYDVVLFIDKTNAAKGL